MLAVMVRKQPGDDEYAPLTARLAGMLEALGHGRSHSDIGLMYGLKASTIKVYLRQARKLLGADTIDEAIAEAARLGIIILAGPGPALPVWATSRNEESNVATKIRLVGGPADGRTYTVPDAPPPLYQVPIVPSIADLAASAFEPAASQAADYQPQLEDGCHRRASDGAYLYEHRAPTVSPEQRQALADARSEASSREARRTAELDAAWVEIRRERPQYPADWRDL